MNDDETCLKDKYKKLPPQIKGPVSYRQSNEGGYEVLDGDGEVQLRVRGRELARQVSGLLQWHLDLGVLY